MKERLPTRRLNASLWPLWSGVTWGKGGPHSGYRHLADKDEVPGSSPGRPTTQHLTSGNTTTHVPPEAGPTTKRQSAERWSASSLRSVRRLWTRMTPHNWHNCLRCHGRTGPLRPVVFVLRGAADKLLALLGVG